LGLRASLGASILVGDSPSADRDMFCFGVSGFGRLRLALGFQAARPAERDWTGAVIVGILYVYTNWGSHLENSPRAWTGSHSAREIGLAL